MSYAIRSARMADIAALAEIELAAARLLEGFAPEAVLAETTEEERFSGAVRKGLLWVACEGDEPVGFALVEMLAEDLPHLEEIDVHPSHGRRGLGTSLVRRVCEWACDAGYGLLTLSTFRKVAWNLPFYARMGFREIRREDWRAELAAVVAHEAARGLDIDARAVMGYQCGAIRSEERK